MPTPAAGDGMATLSSSFGRLAIGHEMMRRSPFGIGQLVHADPVLASWLELVAKTPQLDSQACGDGDVQGAIQGDRAGLCASCHSVEQSEGGSLAINWHSLRSHERTAWIHEVLARAPSHATATGELHELPRDRRCGQHGGIVLRFESAAVRERVQTDDEATCARMPHATAAGDRCQSCHNYHVESVEPWRLRPRAKRKLAMRGISGSRKRLIPPSALRPSALPLELPAELGASAAHVGRIVKQAVHHVEPQAAWRSRSAPGSGRRRRTGPRRRCAGPGRRKLAARRPPE